MAELAAKGIKAVTYASGRTEQIDVAVRRAVMTGISQTAGQIQLDFAAEMDCDLVEVTAHMGARPSHAVWQGQVFSISGKHKKYPKLATATGYGTGDGLKGWNCRHDFYPFFEGISERANLPVDADENAKEYELSQKQRAMERSIRKSKRSLAALEAAIKSTDDPELKQKLQNKFDRTAFGLKSKENKLEEFCYSNGLSKQNDRVRVIGFGKGISNKAVAGSRHHFVKAMKSLDLFKRMKYNNPPEYHKMNVYIKSVKKGNISPLIGYDKYSEVHNQVNSTVVGNTTSNGIKITGQSDHFLERVYRVSKDPKTGRERKGVDLADIQDALINGKAKKPKHSRDENGNLLYDVNGKPKISQKFVTDKCEVTVNPDMGVLVQCNPQ